jgi:hypothetical protein
MCDRGWLKPSVLVSEYEKCPEKRCPYNHTWLKGVKTLSVIMPWPWLIMNFGKDVENRSWRTDYRGRLLIHVSKKPAPNYLEILDDVFFPGINGKNTEENWSKINREYCGNIVGSVELVDCIKNSKSRWAEKGMWHWVLLDPIPLENPIPAKGALGLWEYTGDIR